MNTSESSSRRPEPGLIYTLLDELASAYAGAGFQSEITAAREEYFGRCGKVFEDDAEVHEAFTVSFLEWYVVDRPLAGGAPPAVRFLEKTRAAAAPDGNRLDALSRIAASHHSLFDIAHVDANAIELEDVLGGARFQVQERRSTIGFEVGALFEARLLWDGMQTIFAKTFLFHPRDARSEILDMVDAALAVGTPHDEIMFRLAQLYLRWHRHGHTNAARIYRGGSTVGPVPL